jgi:hypothetical protein
MWFAHINLIAKPLIIHRIPRHFNGSFLALTLLSDKAVNKPKMSVHHFFKNTKGAANENEEIQLGFGFNLVYGNNRFMPGG